MLQLENLTLGSFQTNRRSVIHVKFFSMMSSAMRCPAFATAQSCAKGVKGGAKDDDELGMDTCHRWVSKYSVKFLSSQLIIDNRVLNSPIYGHAVLFRFSPWYFSSFYLQCDRQLYPTYYHESRSEECPQQSDEHHARALSLARTSSKPGYGISIVLQSCQLPAGNR